MPVISDPKHKFEQGCEDLGGIKCNSTMPPGGARKRTLFSPAVDTNEKFRMINLFCHLMTKTMFLVHNTSRACTHLHAHLGVTVIFLLFLEMHLDLLFCKCLSYRRV